MRVSACRERTSAFHESASSPSASEEPRSRGKHSFHDFSQLFRKLRELLVEPLPPSVGGIVGQKLLRYVDRRADTHPKGKIESFRPAGEPVHVSIADRELGKVLEGAAVFDPSIRLDIDDVPIIDLRREIAQIFREGVGTADVVALFEESLGNGFSEQVAALDGVAFDPCTLVGSAGAHMGGGQMPRARIAETLRGLFDFLQLLAAPDEAALGQQHEHERRGVDEGRETDPIPPLDQRVGEADFRLNPGAHLSRPAVFAMRGCAWQGHLAGQDTRFHAERPGEIVYGPVSCRASGRGVALESRDLPQGDFLLRGTS